MKRLLLSFFLSLHHFLYLCVRHLHFVHLLCVVLDDRDEFFLVMTPDHESARRVASHRLQRSRRLLVLGHFHFFLILGHLRFLLVLLHFLLCRILGERGEREGKSNRKDNHSCKNSFRH